MRLSGLRRQPRAVRRALLPDRHPVHRVRPRSRVPVPVGGVAGRHRLGELDRDDDLPRRARPWPRLRLEEGPARMRVTLDPRLDPMPTEEELARLAGLVPGDADMAKLNALRSELDDKGFLVTTTED